MRKSIGDGDTEIDKKGFGIAEGKVVESIERRCRRDDSLCTRMVDMMDTFLHPRAVQQVGHPEDATKSIPDLPRYGGIILVCGLA